MLKRFFSTKFLRNEIKFTEQAKQDFKAQAEREHHAEQLGDKWKKAAIYGCGPLVVLLTIYSLRKEMEHLSHAHKEDTEYEYLFIRKKPFPWGDGKKSFFHSDKFNHVKGQ
eukprot:NODE_43_length_33755_cov_1.178542.p36 type:complete len:111 gc:universal NODE_43_length_33755_cov_1.178542:28080-28412(+)